MSMNFDYWIIQGIFVILLTQIFLLQWLEIIDMISY